MIDEKIWTLLNHLPIGENFSILDNDDIGDFVEEFFTYNYGATKLVLIPKDDTLNYVIKIPYTGDYDEWDDNYIDFCGAEDPENPWDYCENEVIRYNIALEHELEDCFAETKLLTYSNGHPIYVQERCTCLNGNYYAHKHSNEECKITSAACKGYTGINIFWLTDFRHYFGEEKLNTFINFIKQNWWDDDLRDSNIGYINDRPVLIDYSSYNEE